MKTRWEYDPDKHRDILEWILLLIAFTVLFFVMLGGIHVIIGLLYG